MAGRTAVGEQCGYGIAVHGDRGAFAWDFRRMGELRVSIGADYQDASYETVLANRTHGEYSAFQPGGGIAMGYDDLKVIEAYNFLKSVVTGEQREPSFKAAYDVAQVQKAMMNSWDSETWEKVAE